jgi:2-amino-4-hydroxy-6-hydroxymethyldihydropteridine diphosphokinase
MLRAFIGLGSNLAHESDDSRQILRDAIAALRRIAIGEVNVSRLYASSPMGPQDQPDYLNAAALFDTELPPHQLLDQLQQLELTAGHPDHGSSHINQRTRFECIGSIRPAI